MQFPSTLPKNDAVSMWSLQGQLLSLAETLMGPRDVSKTICQPVFHDGCPVVINTPDLSGAFAALSRTGEGYWPTVLFELAHETVHLLNPTVGPTSWLEEGIAVKFSIHAQRFLGTTHLMTPNGRYNDALLLVQSLPADVFDTARTLRATAGALNAVKREHLANSFPGFDQMLVAKLVELF